MERKRESGRDEKKKRIEIIKVNKHVHTINILCV